MTTVMTPEAAFTALPEREREIVFHAARYFLTTAEVVRRWLWPDHSHDAVRKALGRMAERGWLARHPLVGQEPYFVPGRHALSALGLRRSTKALGPQALLEHYAVLLGCARRRSDVFTEDEFRSAFPDLSQPGFPAKNFFTDESAGPPRLGWFVVDHDKLSSRLVKKVRKQVGRLLEPDRPDLHRAVFSGALAVHVITATDGKRLNLESAFARKPLQTVPVFVESHPEELGDFFLVKRR
jgi:hypothetical protein